MIIVYCCVYGCKNRQILGVDFKFFRIFMDFYLRVKWVLVIKREYLKFIEYLRICFKYIINGK